MPLFAVLATAALAQGPKPTLTVSTPPKSVVAGSRLTITVSLNIAPGFHGYQNPPAQESEIPVAVKVDGKEFKVLKVAYPPGIDANVAGGQDATKAYEGLVKIPVTLLVPAKVGVKNLKVTVSYQLCDESSCFPPDEVSKVVKVNVVKKAGKV